MQVIGWLSLPEARAVRPVVPALQFLRSVLLRALGRHAHGVGGVSVSPVSPEWLAAHEVAEAKRQRGGSTT